MSKFSCPSSSMLTAEESSDPDERFTSAELFPFKERIRAVFENKTVEALEKGGRRNWMNSVITTMFNKKYKKDKGEKLYPKLENLTREYIKRLLFSMTTYCDAIHENGWVPYATRYEYKDCSLFNIRERIDNFLSDTPKDYLMLTGPEIIGLTFGPAAQEQYEQFLEPYGDRDGEAGHGVQEEEEKESEEQINWDEVDGGKRRKTKRRRSRKRKTKTKKNNKSNKSNKYKYNARKIKKNYL